MTASTQPWSVCAPNQECTCTAVTTEQAALKAAIALQDCTVTMGTDNEETGIK